LEILSGHYQFGSGSMMSAVSADGCVCACVCVCVCVCV